MEKLLRETLMKGVANRQTIMTFLPDRENPKEELPPDITEGFYSGTIKLQEILCAGENIEIGECNASRFEATLTGVDDISGKRIQVYQRIPYDVSFADVLIDHTDTAIITRAGENILLGWHKDYKIPLFTGRVDSAILQSDRVHREIIAYDDFYYNADTNCADRYNEFFETGGLKTVKTLRDWIFDYIGIDQEETKLINDDMPVEQTMSTTALKFSDLLKAICQINGCFGHIDREGVFRYIYLNDDATVYDVSDNYRSNDTTFESYTVKQIDKLQVCDEDGNAGKDVGAIVGEGNNPYIIQGNFLVWGKSAKDLREIAQKIYGKISNVTYRPFSAKLIYSEPYITVGDRLTLTPRYGDTQTINSYVLRNEMEFAQLFHQTLSAEGDELRDEVVDDVNAEINQLKGKTLRITKTVEEYKVELQDEMYNPETGIVSKLTSEFKQTAGEISSTVTALNDEINGKTGLASKITQTAEKIDFVVEGTAQSGFSITDGAVSIIASKIDLTGKVTFSSLSSDFNGIFSTVGNQTVIDGGKIKTGTITAEKLKADKLKNNDLDGFSIWGEQISGDIYTDQIATHINNRADLNEAYVYMSVSNTTLTIGEEMSKADIDCSVNLCNSSNDNLSFFGAKGYTRRGRPLIEPLGISDKTALKLDELLYDLETYGLIKTE